MPKILFLFLATQIYGQVVYASEYNVSCVIEEVELVNIHWEDQIEKNKSTLGALLLQTKDGFGSATEVFEKWLASAVVNNNKITLSLEDRKTRQVHSLKIAAIPEVKMISTVPLTSDSKKETRFNCSLLKVPTQNSSEIR